MSLIRQFIRGQQKYIISFYNYSTASDQSMWKFIPLAEGHKLHIILKKTSHSGTKSCDLIL